MRFIKQVIVKYPLALLDMEIAKDAVLQGEEECVFFLQHEALYSAGKSFERRDFIAKPRYPVYFPNRGGRVTVHSPGQLVIYPIINLKKRNLNIHTFVEMLEQWMIDVLGAFGLHGSLSEKGVGVWVNGAKIGFVGLHIERGVSTHGLCFNVCNDLSLFDAIIPCGINDLKTTSLEKCTSSQVDINEVITLFIRKCCIF
ncbi:MAG: lipoyl(octanoyl) transferase LipB [Alphaproteobacteria bacterium]|nr:lipoyl(octanoyl) transferase LipB [Alphaproteobacteria bacterium]